MLLVLAHYQGLFNLLYIIPTCKLYMQAYHILGVDSGKSYFRCLISDKHNLCHGPSVQHTRKSQFVFIHSADIWYKLFSALKTQVYFWAWFSFALLEK